MLSTDSSSLADGLPRLLPFASRVHFLHNPPPIAADVFVVFSFDRSSARLHVSSPFFFFCFFFLKQYPVFFFFFFSGADLEGEQVHSSGCLAMRQWIKGRRRRRSSDDGSDACSLALMKQVMAHMVVGRPKDWPHPRDLFCSDALSSLVAPICCAPDMAGSPFATHKYGVTRWIGLANVQFYGQVITSVTVGGYPQPWVTLSTTHAGTHAALSSGGNVYPLQAMDSRTISSGWTEHAVMARSAAPSLNWGVICLSL